MNRIRIIRQIICAIALLAMGVDSNAAQSDLVKLTVGYSPISAATLPFFIALEEKLFQKHGLEIAPVFFGGSPLINAAILAGEFPIGLTGGLGIISSQLAGSDLTVIGSYLQVLAIDGWARPEVKSIGDLKGKKIAVSEGLTLSQADGPISKKALRKYNRVQDDATLQNTFEFFQPYFSTSLRTIEKAMANAIKFLDHPKAKQLDPKQTFNNSYVDEAMK